MPESKTNVVVRIVTSEEFGECFAIREEVFVVGQNVPHEIEIDGLDAACTQFLAEIDGEAIGTARMRDLNEKDTKAQRVAVRKPARGLGVGRALMDAIEAEARRSGRTRIVLDAQLAAIPFYERLGYLAEGPIFLDAGIDHRRMTKSLVGSK